MPFDKTNNVLCMEQLLQNIQKLQKVAECPFFVNFVACQVTSMANLKYLDGIIKIVNNWNENTCTIYIMIAGDFGGRFLGGDRTTLM